MYLENIEEHGESCVFHGSQYSGGIYNEYELHSDSCSGEIGWVRCPISTLLYEIELGKDKNRILAIVPFCTNIKN